MEEDETKGEEKKTMKAKKRKRELTQVIEMECEDNFAVKLSQHLQELPYMTEEPMNTMQGRKERRRTVKKKKKEEERKKER